MNPPDSSVFRPPTSDVQAPVERRRRSWEAPVAAFLFAAPPLGFGGIGMVQETAKLDSGLTGDLWLGIFLVVYFLALGVGTVFVALGTKPRQATPWASELRRLIAVAIATSVPVIAAAVLSDGNPSSYRAEPVRALAFDVLAAAMFGTAGALFTFLYLLPVALLVRWRLGRSRVEAPRTGEP